MRKVALQSKRFGYKFSVWAFYVWRAAYLQSRQGCDVLYNLICDYRQYLLLCKGSDFLKVFYVIFEAVNVKIPNCLKPTEKTKQNHNFWGFSIIPYKIMYWITSPITEALLIISATFSFLSGTSAAHWPHEERD